MILGFFEVTTILQLLDVGVAIGMLAVFIRMYLKKDREHEALHKLSTEKLTELVIEATKALQDKNHTDDSMAKALEELTKVVEQQLKEE